MKFDRTQWFRDCGIRRWVLISIVPILVGSLALTVGRDTTSDVALVKVQIVPPDPPDSNPELVVALKSLISRYPLLVWGNDVTLLFDDNRVHAKFIHMTESPQVSAHKTPYFITHISGMSFRYELTNKAGEPSLPEAIDVDALKLYYYIPPPSKFGKMLGRFQRMLLGKSFSPRRWDSNSTANYLRKSTRFNRSTIESVLERSNH